MRVLDLIREVRVVPVVRRPSAASAIELCEQVLAAGAPVIELTATTPDWTRVFQEVRRAAPDVVIGLGTVTSPALARQAAEAGAAFLVSPYPVTGVRAVADAAGIPFIEGGFTPAELAAATAAGVAKLFPAGTVGPAHLKAVLDVLPGARIIPTGGITLATAGEWLAAGAFAVGVGSDLATSPDAPARLRALREG
jgi:2-dehydro-3-deoxyphosphogluconate aldolase/(4S)-4-hydroxy-2-oxoglutarate aldolase